MAKPTHDQAQVQFKRGAYATLCDRVELCGGHVRLARDPDGFVLFVDIPIGRRRRRARFAGISFASITELDDHSQVLHSWVSATLRVSAERKPALTTARRS